MNILEKNEKIIKVLFAIDIIFLIILIFYSSKGLVITSALINIILLGSYLVIKRYSNFFNAMSQTNKIFSGLNKTLGDLDG